MTCKKTFTCDVCGKPIEEGREQSFMTTVIVKGHSYKYDDGSEDWEMVYHIHNDKLCTSDNCSTKLFKLLNAVRKE